MKIKHQVVNIMLKLIGKTWMLINL